MKREPKSERGALLLAPLFSRSLTLVPRSFLLNRTETLATQASFNRLVVFPGDDELIFLLLFETMISQACK